MCVLSMQHTVALFTQDIRHTKEQGAVQEVHIKGSLQ